MTAAGPGGAHFASRPWGLSAAIDLDACQPEPLRDRETIARFMGLLTEAIGMEPFGSLWIKRFGAGELEGWSAIQPIQTSAITLHADEAGGRVMIDVFSCKPFDPGPAVHLAIEFFGGYADLRVLRRGRPWV